MAHLLRYAIFPRPVTPRELAFMRSIFDLDGAARNLEEQPVSIDPLGGVPVEQQQAAQQQQQQQQSQNQPAQVPFICKLLLFADKLSNFGLIDGDRDGRVLDNWQDFVDKHFAPEGRVVLQPHEYNHKMEVPRATIARFFWMYFETGASSLRLHTENGNEIHLPGNKCRLACSNATLTVSYPNGSRVEASGPLSVLYGADMIEGFEFQVLTVEEQLSRSEVEKALSNYSPSMSTKQSPKMTKKNLPKAQQKMQQQQQQQANEGPISMLPKAPGGHSGMTGRMLQFLEVCAL